MDMELLGVLTGASGVGGLTVTVTSTDLGRFSHALVCNDKVLLISHEDPKSELTLTVFVVTPLGREVLRLGSRKCDLDYVRKVGEVIKQKGFSVRLADVSSVSGPQVRFQN